MKKIIVLAIAITSFTAAFSQSHGDRDRKNDNNRSGAVNNRSHDYNQQKQQKQFGYTQNDHRNNDHYRQQQIDRVNRDYNQRIYAYRNNHSYNAVQRDRMIRQAEMERSQKINSFGGGVAVGALAGLIIGAIISH